MIDFKSYCACTYSCLVSSSSLFCWVYSLEHGCTHPYLLCANAVFHFRHFVWPFLFALVIAKYVLNSALAPLLGLPLNHEAAAEADKLLSMSLSKIENIWLKGNGRFLLGGSQPSIADLCLVCEIMQLEVYVVIISFTIMCYLSEFGMAEVGSVSYCLYWPN